MSEDWSEWAARALGRRKVGGAEGRVEVGWSVMAVTRHPPSPSSLAQLPLSRSLPIQTLPCMHSNPHTSKGRGAHRASWGWGGGYNINVLFMKHIFNKACTACSPTRQSKLCVELKLLNCDAHWQCQGLGVGGGVHGAAARMQASLPAPHAPQWPHTLPMSLVPGLDAPGGLEGRVMEVGGSGHPCTHSLSTADAPRPWPVGS
jgi:hypothetical protein